MYQLNCMIHWNNLHLKITQNTLVGILTAKIANNVIYSKYKKKIFDAIYKTNA